MDKKTIRIAWLHSHFLYSTGGTRFVYEVISRLKQEYQITVYVEKASDEWKKKYLDLDVPLVEISSLSSNSLWYWLLFPFFFLNDYFRLRNRLSTADCLISTIFPMNMLGTLISSKTVYFCFEPFAFFYDKRLIQSFPLSRRISVNVLSFFYNFLDNLGVRRSSCLMSINPSVGIWIEKIYKRAPSAYSYLGIDTAFFSRNSGKNSEDESSPFVLFHSTDYTPLKGTFFLLQAMPYVIRKVQNVRLIISETVENPAIKKVYESFVQRNGLAGCVVFRGHLPYRELAGQYAASNAYCFTGDPDSAGATAASLSVLEASASGLAVVRSIGNDDEVIDGVTGYLVDPRDPEALSTRLCALAADRQLCKRMGENGRRYVTEKYTWEHVALSFQHVVENVVNNVNQSRVCAGQ